MFVYPMKFLSRSFLATAILIIVSQVCFSLQICHTHVPLVNMRGGFKPTHLRMAKTYKANANERAAMAEETRRESGGASVSTSSFNLAKSIVGAGVLSLPGGVALFSDQPKALLPATLACGAFALMGAYSFSMIGRICEEHNAKTFKEAWSKSISPTSSWIITSIVASLCFLGSLAYSIIIGDSFSALFQVRFGMDRIGCDVFFDSCPSLTKYSTYTVLVFESS